MTAEQVAADARDLIDQADAHTKTLTRAADLALSRRMVGVESWFRFWARERVNLAGPIPAEYALAVDTARLIMEGRTA
ncbi:hypothetical protein KGD82_16645 [Nocardiopsis eucommiae]|uniref:Uncharacterized protein n=1 Tax=Nocardiopsis eucommiae TaxID=2831970 RepID=A0A975L877_9ACTN|nr:hypothetical protein KGD82_16645 [Nocardiopsis eucommiae]